MRVRRRDQWRALFGPVEQALAPTLGQGDVVVLDNLGAHKVKDVRKAIEAVGAQLTEALQHASRLH